MMRKEERRILIVGAALLAVLVVLAGCMNPLSGPEAESTSTPGDTGAVSVGIGSGLSASAIAPTISLDVASYEVSLTSDAGTPGDPADDVTVGPSIVTDAGRDIMFTGLSEGQWQVAVDAKNTSGVLVGTGSNAVSVLAGQTTRVTVTVALLSGTGTVQLQLQYPGHLVQNPSVAAFLTENGTTTDVSTDFIGDAASDSFGYFQTLETGVYTLAVQLKDSGQVIWGTPETIIVVSGETSSHTWTLDQSQIKYAPEAVANLTTGNVTTKEVELRWDDVSLVEQVYRVERSSDSGATWTDVLSEAELRANSESYTDESVSEGTPYRYRVVGVNTWGETASATLEVTTPVANMVGGSLSENTVWEAGSFYVVSSTLTVPAGVELVIEPGVNVAFSAGAGLSVQGALIAVGTATNPIVFTSDSDSPSPGAWETIELGDSTADAVFDSSGDFVAGSTLQHVIVRWGRGVKIRNSFPYIADASIENAAGITSSEPTSAFWAQYSNGAADSAKSAVFERIAVPTPAVTPVVLTSSTGAKGTVTIRNSEFSAGNDSWFVGMRLTPDSTLFTMNVTDVTVEGFGQTGIRIQRTTNSGTYVHGEEVVYVERATLSGNETGLGAYDVSSGIVVRDSTITQNAYRGVDIGWTPVRLIGNNVVGNSRRSTEPGYTPLEGGAISIRQPNVAPVVSQNDISGNHGRSAVYLEYDWTGTGSVVDNTLDNPDVSWEIELENTSSPIDATDNYWGTTVGGIADAHMRVQDNQDDAALGVVTVDPLKDVSGLTGTMLVEATYPADGSVEATSAVELRWRSFGPADSYLVEVAEAADTGFAAPLVSTTTQATSVSLSGVSGAASLSHGGSYIWRVTALDAGGVSSDPSAARGFSLDLPAIEAVSPGDGAVWYDAGAVLLDWKDEALASVYDVEVAGDSAFSAVVTQQSVTGSSFEVPVDLVGGTDYYWRVSIRDANGVSGPASTVRTFHYPEAGVGVEIIDTLPRDVGLSIVTPNAGIAFSGVPYSLFSQGEVAGPFSWFVDGASVGSGRTATITRDAPGTYNITARYDVAGSSVTAQTTISVVPVRPVRFFAINYGSVALANSGQGRYAGDVQVVAPSQATSPTAAEGIEGITDWSRTGWSIALQLKADGTVWAYGSLNSGLGDTDGTTYSYNAPVFVDSLSDIVDVATGEQSAYAVAADGTLYSWGLNGNGQLGHADYLSRGVPTAVDAAFFGGSPVVEVEAMYSSVVARTADGSVYSWGNGATNSPQLVSGVAGAVDVASRGSSGYVVTGGGTLYEWYTNASPTATSLSLGGASAVSVVAGGNHGLIVDSLGNLWVHGSNWDGQLGTGDKLYRNSPEQLATVRDVADVFASRGSSYALLRDGTLLAWGANSSGQLGVGDTGIRLTPTEVDFGW
jgi:hypothetical protein